MEELRTPHRPKYRVTKPQQRGDQTQPWTASRCRRLLRPLLSRLALLRRDAALLHNQSLRIEAPREELSAKRSAEDCTWLAPRKKLRRTYSQRSAGYPLPEAVKPAPVKFKAAKDLQRDSCTGEIIAFTPLLRRVRGHHVSSPVEGPQTSGNDGQHHRKRKSGPSSIFDERLTSIRMRVSPTRYADYEAIFRNTDALLNAVSRSPSNKGASALMDMCLRKMPRYVAGVVAWEVHEAEKDGTRSNTTGADVASRVYTELESLGASDTGWAHLRTLVEADAVSALADAMAEGLFPDEFAMMLIELCSGYGVRQLGDLLEVFLARQYPQPLNTEEGFSENASLRPLSFLRDISARSGRSTLLLQQLSILLVQGLLPYTWLATKQFEEIWASAYRMLARGRTSLDPVDYLATSIVLLCRQQQLNDKQVQPDLRDECHQASTSALSVLSSMRRLNQDELLTGCRSNSERIERIGRGLAFVFNACLMETRSWKGRRGRPRDLLCLATFLSSPESQGERIDASVARIIKLMREKRTGELCPTRQSDNDIYSLIAAVARICGRGTSQASRYYLLTFCKQLGRLDLGAEVLEDIKQGGAFFLAQQSNDLRDLLYAEKLVTASVDHSSGQTCLPGKPTLFEGYRWDETISEWVTVSPAAEKKSSKRRSFRSLTNSGAGQIELLRRPPGSEIASPVGLSDLTSCAADSFGNHGSSVYAIFETSDSMDNAVLQQASGISSRPNRDPSSSGNSGRDTALLNGRKSSPSSTKALNLHDELGNDKENRGQQIMTEKRRGGGTRKSHPTKRRIRLSGGDCHSDDELAI
ncbi:hypothetical protein SCUP234_13304 [Seiridium cupressi]